MKHSRRQPQPGKRRTGTGLLPRTRPPTGPRPAARLRHPRAHRSRAQRRRSRVGGRCKQGFRSASPSSLLARRRGRRGRREWSAQEAQFGIGACQPDVRTDERHGQPDNHRHEHTNDDEPNDGVRMSCRARRVCRKHAGKLPFRPPCPTGVKRGWSALFRWWSAETESAADVGILANERYRASRPERVGCGTSWGSATLSGSLSDE